MGKNFYQHLRARVKMNLQPVISDWLGMEPAIRTTTTASVDEVETALAEHLGAAGFHVIQETDVKAIHNHYRLQYPDYRILKVVKAQTFNECPLASTAIRRDPSTSALLPPGIVIYDLDGVTHVSAIRPSTLLAVVRDPEVQDTIIELEAALWDALATGVPGSDMPDQEVPIRPDDDGRRGALKRRLNLVLSLADAEYTVHVSTPRSPAAVLERLRDALARRGQHVVGEVAGGQTLLVVNPGQAHKALAIDPDVGVFAPLSVAVLEGDDRTHVRCVRPTTLLIFYDQPDLQDILMEMEMLLWNGIVAGVPEGRIESRQPPLQPEGGQRASAGGLPGGLGSARWLAGD